MVKLAPSGSFRHSPAIPTTGSPRSAKRHLDFGLRVPVNSKKAEAGAMQRRELPKRRPSAEIENRRSALALGREAPPHARQRHTVAASDQRYRHLSHPHIIGGRWHCQFSEMFQLGGGQRSSIVLLFDVALVVVAHGGETLAGCGRVRSGPERSFAAHVCDGRRPRSRIMVRQT
jgi:hypothetical protein